MMQVHTLPNGARLLLVPAEGTEVTTIMATFRVGSRDETDDLAGASHLIEHMMFKGGKVYPTSEHLSKALDRYGAEYNASTGEEETEYYIDIESSRAVEAIGILADMLLEAQFDEGELKKEREVIVEEIKMYEENPSMHLSSLFAKSLYGQHALGRDIAGSIMSVRGIERSALLGYRDAHYRAENVVLTLAGKITDEMIAAFELAFAKLMPGNRPLLMPAPERSSLLHAGVITDERSLQQTQLALGVPIPGKADCAASAPLRILSRILGGTMSSRLFIELREKRGLCYAISASCRQHHDVGAFVLRAAVDSARLPETMMALRAEWQKLCDYGVGEEELAAAKDNIAGSLAIALESPHAKADFFASQVLFDYPLETPAERLERFRAVTVEDINAAIRQYFQWEHLSVATIGPHGTTEIKDYLSV